jgi:cellulose synthase/poly-beta-1,6-N-acetylglucosamine synthase-like glycosyltransferase
MTSASTSAGPWLPMCTVGIPCLDEEGYIEDCVRCVLAQDYPADRLEIIIADGGSKDATRAILDRLAAAHPQLRWIDNPGRIQAAAMNEIIGVARGEVLIRLDAHGEYAPSYIRKCIEVMARTGADNVGGAARPRAKSRFQRALCAALASPMGVGGAKFRREDSEGFVDTVFNGAFRLELFDRIGGYDPGAVVNEDAELNQRILAAGGRIYISREIEAYYYPRASYGALARQYFKYGVGRARTMLKHGGLPTVRPMIPFAAVMSGATLLATSRWHRITLPALAAYGALAGVEAIRVGRREGPWAIPIVWTIFPVMHVAHGLGFAAGLWRFLRKPDWHARGGEAQGGEAVSSGVAAPSGGSP